MLRCVSNDEDPEMTSVGFVTGLSNGKCVNMVIATDDSSISVKLKPGASYSVTFTLKSDVKKKV